MSTGYFYADWRQGGAVPGRFATTAGAMLTILDYLLTTGSDPWVKTVTGTNQAKYKAPGGSQIEIEVEDNYALSASLVARVTSVVGAITFPTVSQRTNATGGMGTVYLRKGSSTTVSYGWYGVRTDRMFMLFSACAASSVGGGTVQVFGDLPVYDPADPGLCVAISAETGQTAFPKTTKSNDGFSTALSGGGHVPAGYCSINKLNTIGSVQLYAMSGYIYQNYQSQNIVNYGGVFPRYPVMVSSNLDQTGTTTVAATMVPRGYIPFLYWLPFSGNITTSGLDGVARVFNNATGDTFTDGAAEFELYAMNGGGYPMYAMMTNDQEPLP